VWALFGKMADLAVLSLLWTLCSLPIITMGAASAALMRCALNMNTGEGNWRTRHFFRYFRRNLRNATPMWLLYLLAAALLTLDLLILSGAGGASARLQRMAAVLGLIILTFNAVWAFALTSQFENGVIRTIKNAFYLGVSWLPRTILMSALWLVPVALAVFNPYILSRIIVLWPALFFGGTAYFCAKLMVKPLTPYFEESGIYLSAPPEEDEEDFSE